MLAVGKLNYLFTSLRSKYLTNCNRDVNSYDFVDKALKTIPILKALPFKLSQTKFKVTQIFNCTFAPLRKKSKISEAKIVSVHHSFICNRILFFTSIPEGE